MPFPSKTTTIDSALPPLDVVKPVKLFFSQSTYCLQWVPASDKARGKSKHPISSHKMLNLLAEMTTANGGFNLLELASQADASLAG